MTHVNGVAPAFHSRAEALDRRGQRPGALDGTAPDGRSCLFAADHRSAQGIADALEAGEGPVYAYVKSWQVLG